MSRPEDDFDQDTGEVRGGVPAPFGGGLPVEVNASAVSSIVRAEIDSQIATARAYPRNIQRVVQNIGALATMDEDTAEECLYALVRGKKKKKDNNGGQEEENKPIEGPSIRLAEIAAQCYGNCRIEARVVTVNRAEKYIEAEGVFIDLETNMASKASVRRRISTKGGYLFSDDMIIVTGNAACAIAKRNAILAGIPRGVYRPAYLAARKMVAGDATTLVQKRDEAIKAFARYGIKPEQLVEALSLASETDITSDHLVTLRGMYGTLMRGEATPEEMFAKGESDHKRIANPLSDDDPKTASGASSADSKVDTSPARIARDLGAKARAEGKLRKSIPAEYRAEDRKAEADAWFEGYDAEPEGGEYQPGQEG